MEALDSGHVFNFKTEKHVSWMYSAFGFLAFMTLALILGSGNLLAGFPPVVLGVIVFTISKGVKIHPEGRYYMPYSSILGYHMGQKIPFESVDYLFLTRSRQAQKMAFASMQGTAIFYEYLGWVRFSEKDKVTILKNETKEKLMRDLENLRVALQTTIVDYTEED